VTPLGWCSVLRRQFSPLLRRTLLIVATFSIPHIVWPADQTYNSGSPRWERSFEAARAEFDKGHGFRAKALAIEAVQQTLLSQPREQYRARRGLQDICFAMYDSACATEQGVELARLFPRTFADASENDKRSVMSEALASWTQLLLLLKADASTLKVATSDLEKSVTWGLLVPNFIHANLLLAEAAINRRDIERARFFTQRAWLYFLSNRGLSDREFLRDVPRFVSLFRNTGQTWRAATTLAISERTLTVGSNLLRYEGLAVSFAEHDVSSDLNQLPSAIRVANKALSAISEIDLEQSARRFLRAATLTALLVDCSLQPIPECPGEDAARELESFALEANTNFESGRGTFFPRNAAIALTMRAALQGAPFNEGLKTILMRPPADTANPLDAGDKALFHVGKFFLAVLDRNDAERDYHALVAAENELKRLRAFRKVEPYDLAPLNAYTRVMFQVAVAILGGRPNRTPTDNDELFEMVGYLNRTIRNVESDSMYLLAQTSDRPLALSLQAFHRTEQNLARLERKSLAELVDELWARKPERPPSKFDGDRWGQLTQLVTLNEARQDAHQWVSEVGNAPTRLLQSTQAVLRDDERFITHALLGQKLLRLCVDGRELHVAVADIDLQKTIIAIKIVKAALTNPRPPSEELDSTFPIEATELLSNLLLGTDGDCFKDASYLIFAPLPDMTTLPVNILLDPVRGERGGIRRDDFSNIPWLATAYGLSTVIDAKQFVASRKLRLKQDFSEPFLGVGAPKLSGKLRDGEGAKQFALRGTKLEGGVRLEELTELPETAGELSDLATVFGPNSEVLLGTAATELAFRQRILRNYRVLDFATHGLVREEVEGVNEPALLLTPYDSKAETNDGILSANEIAQLDLSADLVILSACNSARYDLDVFGPEAASLSTAFFLAGARATLASLWSVESDATAKLMKLFAREYALPLSPGASIALKHAIQQFLKSAPREYLHPRYWAAFSVYGDGGPAAVGANAEPEMQLRSLHLEAAEKWGELIYSRHVEGGYYVAGFRDTGKKRVTWQLQFVGIDGKQQWAVEDEEFYFLLTENSWGYAPRVLAARYTAGGPSQLQLRKYSSNGRLTQSITVPTEDTELVTGFLQLGENRFVVVSTTDRVHDNVNVIVKGIDASGNVVKTLTIPVDDRSLGAPEVRALPARSGFWVSIKGVDETRPPKRVPSTLGSPRGCIGAMRTDLFRLSWDLEEIAKPERLEDIEVLDAVVTSAGDEVLAVAIDDPCSAYLNARSGILLKQPDKSNKIMDISLPGFSASPRRLVLGRSGEVVLIGSAYRNVDFWHRTEPYSGWENRRAEQIRGYSSYRQRGGYVASFDKTFGSQDVQLFFAGADLFLSDIVERESDWLVVGTSADVQFMGSLKNIGPSQPSVSSWPRKDPVH
jgi:CHAT domain-containing protein